MRQVQLEREFEWVQAEQELTGPIQSRAPLVPSSGLNLSRTSLPWLWLWRGKTFTAAHAAKNSPTIILLLQGQVPAWTRPSWGFGPLISARSGTKHSPEGLQVCYLLTAKTEKLHLLSSRERKKCFYLVLSILSEFQCSRYR